MDRIRQLLTDESTRSLATAVFAAAADRPALAALTREFFADRQRREREIFARAARCGPVWCCDRKPRRTISPRRWWIWCSPRCRR
ncbi:MAG TPA: hypothetical protein VE172_03495 [Stackebrandtia sp.]|uniref:hypothetical protein n=1 Tax=Stackebrandtia sp. TaxID=2023065 RepID=UPI002D6C3E87|nr:hypothetical protein [Stackebrandtia sp.]HZE37852.1 hypothetical protein [Stackebrandtia sp.]